MTETDIVLKDVRAVKDTSSNIDKNNSGQCEIMTKQYDVKLSDPCDESVWPNS